MRRGLRGRCAAGVDLLELPISSGSGSGWAAFLSRSRRARSKRGPPRAGDRRGRLRRQPRAPAAAQAKVARAMTSTAGATSSTGCGASNRPRRTQARELGRARGAGASLRQDHPGRRAPTGVRVRCRSAYGAPDRDRKALHVRDQGRVLESDRGTVDRLTNEGRARRRRARDGRRAPSPCGPGDRARGPRTAEASSDHASFVAC
jgi:hypothetical protein